MTTWRSTALAAAAALLCLLAAWGTGRALREADLHEQGRAVYNFRCYFCHG